MEEDEPVELMKLGPVQGDLIITNIDNGHPKENGEIIKSKESEKEILDKNLQARPSQILTTTSSQSQLRSKRRLSQPKPMKTQFSSASMTSEMKKLGSTEAFGRRLSGSGPRRNFSTSSFAHISTPFHGSTLSAFEKPNEFASQFSLRSVSEGVTDVVYCCCCFKRKKSTEGNAFFDISLLQDPAYLVILFSSSTVAISCTNFLILLPSFAQNVGFDKDQGALLLSTVSALDLVGRIGGSTLCDLNLIPKPVYFIGGLVVSGIALAVLPFLSTYLMISVFCAIFGLASGINNSVTTLIMAEILGVERLMSTYGISLFVNGILQLVGPFVCGAWFQREQNFINMFVTFGVIFIAGASLWAFMPLINKRKRMKEAMEKPSNQSRV